MFKKLFSWQVSLFFLTLFSVCGILVRTIGSSVDEQGFLQEPFAFIAIGGISLYLGLIIGGVFLVRRLLPIFLRRLKVS